MNSVRCVCVFDYVNVRTKLRTPLTAAASRASLLLLSMLLLHDDDDDDARGQLRRRQVSSEAAICLRGQRMLPLVLLSLDENKEQVEEAATNLLFKSN